MSEIVLSCEGLCKGFHDGTLQVNVLRGVSFSIKQGEMVAILGASGSGKSTLLHLLGGLDTVSAGEVMIAGSKMASLSEQRKGLIRNRYLGFIYQFHHLLPELNALENVCIPLLIGGCAPKIAEQKASELLDKVGLAERVLHRIGELSGGERQRVAIARALVTNPVCVLADEPTGNLDHQTSLRILELMLTLNRESRTSFVIVTHDIALANCMDRRLILQDGVLVEE